MNLEKLDVANPYYPFALPAMSRKSGEGRLETHSNFFKRGGTPLLLFLSLASSLGRGGGGGPRLLLLFSSSKIIMQPINYSDPGWEVKTIILIELQNNNADSELF